MSFATPPDADTCAFTAVPVVDIGDRTNGRVARLLLAERLGDISHHVGFVIVTGHGIAPEVIGDVLEQAAGFFALSEADKRSIDKRRSRHFRGWEPVGSESTNNRPDMREQIDLWTDHPARPRHVMPGYLRLLGPNQWPPEQLAPGFRPALERWFAEMGALADDLLRLLALSLELEENHFDAAFGDERMSLTKLISYPETPPGQFGVNAHHDTGFLTILAPGTTPGLEVENAAGDWIPVPVVPGSLVVNLGEILQAITGNYFVATPHRVVTRAPRLSAGYFHGPSLDMALEPLGLHRRFAEAVANSPHHKRAGFMAQRDETAAGVGDMQSRHHPRTYGEQLWNYFARSYPEHVARHWPASDAGPDRNVRRP
jgi:isopenicillin N synthase-like dioxygenase